MDDKQAKELLASLESIKRLLAHQVAQQHETLELKAVALAACGLMPKDIATVCNSTPNAVSVKLSAAKRKKKRRT